MAIFTDGEPLDIDALNGLASEVKQLTAQLATQKTQIGDLGNAMQATSIAKVYGYTTGAVTPATTIKPLTLKFPAGIFAGAPNVVVTPYHDPKTTKEVNLNYYVHSVTATSAILEYFASSWPSSTPVRFYVVAVYMAPNTA